MIFKLNGFMIFKLLFSYDKTDRKFFCREYLREKPFSVTLNFMNTNEDQRSYNETQLTYIFNVGK